MSERQDVYEREINLTELLFYCLKKWRIMVIFMLVFAVLAGAYKYVSVVKENQNKRETQEQLIQQAEEEEVISNPNVEYYNRAVASTQQELDKMKDYLDHSVIMQMEFHQLYTGTVSFYIDVEDNGQIKNSLIAAYQAYVTDGRLTDELLKADDHISEAELQYLIEFRIEEFPVVEENYEIAEGETTAKFRLSGMGESKSNVFRVQITSDTVESCELYTKAAQEVLEQYSLQLQEQIGRHELRFLASAQTERIDQKIQDYQKSIRNTYIDTYNQLKTLESELETIIAEEGETIVVGNAAAFASPTAAAVKYAVIGLVLGAFLSAFLLVLFYMMSGKLQSTSAFAQEYGMPLLGKLSAHEEKKRVFGFLDRWICRLEQGTYADIPYEEQVKIVISNIKAAIAKEGLKKVMLAGTIEKESVEAVCTEIAKEITKEITEVSFSSYGQIVYNAEALEKLNVYEGVVFLEKQGESDSKLILREKALAENRNVKALGAVVL